MGKRRGKASKQARAKQEGNLEEAERNAPHSFVINRGHVGKNVQDLILDVRKVMEPYTAAKLKTRKKNVLKDFINVAGLFHVSHILMFSKTEASVNLRIARMPRGPTLTFQVKSYTLAKDVISSLKRHNMEPKQFQHHPLLVMNNFSGEGMHLKLMATMFQNMLPSLNVNKIKLNDIRRCLLLNFDQENETIELRHYNIRAVPVGMSKAVKKLVKAKIPDMSRFDDVSEFIMKGGNLSESEGEMDGPHNEVVLPQKMSSRGNIKAAKSAIRLTEIGPRMTLQLIKIEERVCEGDVLYHRLIQKTEEEIAAIKTFREQKKLVKLQRRQKQLESIQAKEKSKEKLKEKCLAGMSKAEDEDKTSSLVEAAAGGIESDDDAEYFRQEVGEEPDAEWFPKTGTKRKLGHVRKVPMKKRKVIGTKEKNPMEKRVTYSKTKKHTEKFSKFNQGKKSKTGQKSNKRYGSNIKAKKINPHKRKFNKK